MNKYFAITFRAKQDTILMRDSFLKGGINCSIVNANGCVDSVCAYMLKIENISLNHLKSFLGNCNRARQNVYMVKEDFNKTTCLKLI